MLKWALQEAGSTGCTASGVLDVFSAEYSPLLLWHDYPFLWMRTSKYSHNWSKIANFFFRGCLKKVQDVPSIGLRISGHWRATK